ncbi:MAG TPA: alpha/beta hydrolase [Trebonia sp.]|nr:alpha/beta hydrolase [Trebonia sp.]
MTAPLLLVHGGLWEAMNADRFWVRPGVVAGLAERGVEVLAPDRPQRAPSWTVEARALADAVSGVGRVRVLAGSNGCSAAVRFALAEPDRVERLILAWPATAGDPEVDARQRREFAALGATDAIANDLLAGETLRGSTDAELATLTMRTAIIPSDVDGMIHRHRTVDALCRSIPGAVRLPEFPESPKPTFPARCAAFLDAVTNFLSNG